MNRLNILQSNGIETVGNSSNTIGVRTVEKLYLEAKDGLDNELEVELEGSILVDKAYRDSVEWLLLNTDLNITVSSDYYIRFRDSEVARVLISQYGDGVGITESVASAVTRLNKILNNNTLIEHFDELGKFTSITILPNYTVYYSPSGDFGNCTNLISIDLSNITEVLTGLGNCPNLSNLGDFHPTWIEAPGGYSYAFYSDISLTHVDLSNCVALGEKAFDGCTSLSDIGSFLSMDYIGGWAFGNCTSLTIDLRLPALGNNIAHLKDNGLGSGRVLLPGAFHHSGIISVSDLGRCNKFENGWYQNSGWYCTGCFANCKNLTFVNLPLDFYYLGTYSFEGCSSLTTINGIEHVTEVHGRVFFDCKGFINSVLYCRDLTELNYLEFGESYIKLLYLPGVTITAKSAYMNSDHYHEGAFQGTQIKLLYFRDITTFHTDFMYSNIPIIVINNTTVPSINPTNDDFNYTDLGYNPNRAFVGATIGAIYVPDGYESAYQSHSIWGTKTIKPISELSKVATKALWDELTDALKDITLIEEYM